MSTKFTAAQLRGLKAEHEKEMRQELINTIVKQIKDKCIEYAKKGDTKCILNLISNPGDNYMTISWNKYSSIQTQGKCTEELVADCIRLLTDELTDCLIDGEMEEIIWQKGLTRLKFTITIDWSIDKPEAATLPEVSEVEKLKARIAELEEENSRLKSNSTVGHDSQITSDLLDIFAGFGAIIPK